MNLECRVTKVEELGSHHLFLAEVLAVHADEAYLDENNRFALEKTRPLAYVHGQYYGLGNLLGTFGYSVRKRKKTRKKRRKMMKQIPMVRRKKSRKRQRMKKRL